MIFSQPKLLFLLLLPTLFIYWIWVRQSGRIALPIDHLEIKKGWNWSWLIKVCESLPGIIAAIIILVLAGPQKISEPKSKRVLTNIEFCVDISCSMTAEFGSGTRYDASMKSIVDFLDRRPDDAFGLTFFGNSVLHWVPLSYDTSAIRCAPPFMRPENAPPWFGGTEIGKALLACEDVLTQRETGDRMIILVSDGQSFDLENGRDLEIARKLRENNISVNAIHIGDSEIPGSVVNVTTLTGGEAFNPDDEQAFKAVFARIDAMQETKLETANAESQDNFPPFVYTGLGAVALYLLSLFGLRFNPW